MWRIEWSRDWWRHVTLKDEGRDPDVFGRKCRKWLKMQTRLQRMTLRLSQSASCNVIFALLALIFCCLNVWPRVIAVNRVLNYSFSLMLHNLHIKTTRITGSRTLRPQDTSAPTLSRITGGAVSCRNCPGSKVSRLFVDLMPKCLVPRFWRRSVLRRCWSVLCGSEVSCGRSVR